MGDLVKILLVSAAMLTSVSAGDSKSSQKPFFPPKIDIKLIGGGRNYHAEVSVEYEGQKVTADYNVKVNWQFLYNGQFSLTRNDEISTDTNPLH